MMTPGEAHDFRFEHDDQVRRLNRRKVADLAEIWAGDLRRRGMVSLFGGPGTKDELISAIIESWYPVAKLNESTHVLHHRPGESWSACEWCHPHGGQTCECPLRLDVAKAAMQARLSDA